jgi:hypothetical protein
MNPNGDRCRLSHQGVHAQMRTALGFDAQTVGWRFLGRLPSNASRTLARARHDHSGEKARLRAHRGWWTGRRRAA